METPARMPKVYAFHFRHRMLRNMLHVTTRNDDLRLVFGRPIALGETVVQRELSTKVMTYWSFFAKTG